LQLLTFVFFCTSQVSNHLFIFEGNGEVKDFPGTLSEYASALIDVENDGIADKALGKNGSDAGESSKKDVNRDDKAKRNEYRNSIRQVRRDLENVERAIEKLKLDSTKKQNEIDNSSAAGWSVLASLTDELNQINETIDLKEIKWMELAEQLEAAEIDA
jgi:ABC transport system ATP-binding/permease protein